MDEQTTLQPQEQINSPEQQQYFFAEQTPEPQENFSQSKTDSQETPDLSINEDGDINFSDEFLSDVEKSFFGDKPASQPEGNTPAQPQTTQPNYYTDEELANTPYEQWDINRLNGDIKKFVPIVQEQLQKRQMQQRVAQNAQRMPDFLQNQPKQYTPKELNDEARKLACQRLGLVDPDDLDVYEGEHRAALDLAMQELVGNRNREIAEYGRRSASWQELQNFNNALVSQPDYQEFNKWYLSRIKELNATPQQIQDYLYDKAVQNGYNFGLIQQEIYSWYREFQQSKTQRPRAKMPPKLESTRGGYSDSGRSVNLRDFGNMDPEAQAQALIQMGYV